MDQKGFANIAVIIGIIVLVGIAGYFVVSQQLPSPSPTPKPVSIPGLRFEASPMLGAPPLNVSIGAFSENPLQFDTFTLDYGDDSQETLNQQCISNICQVRSTHTYQSSGTFIATLRGIKNGNSQIIGTLTISVGNPLTVTKTVGENESSFLIQKINRDSVDGLWYQAYPVATGQGTPKTLHLGDDIGYACEGVSDKLTGIDFSNQKVTFTVSWSQPPLGGCPICLSHNTLIDTPAGLIPVKDLQVGMQVWTTDKTGQRVSSIITKTSKVPVPSNHQMVHLVLNDGRDLFASPGHPTIDGRTVGDLTPGEIYDSAIIVSSVHVPYDDSATYDLLPSGDTGFYWANGILVGSTLR